MMKAHQELALLLPAGALGVGVPVGLGHHADEVPLRRVGLRPRLQRAHHLLLLPPLPVLLDETPLGHSLRLVQHHCGRRRQKKRGETGKREGGGE